MTELGDQSAVTARDRERMQQLANRTPRLSERHPVLYPLAVWVCRTRRRVQWLRGDEAWATRRMPQSLGVRVKSHKSLLMRQLGDSEMYLQHNKVTNLKLAVDRVDGLLIGPGETFSFNKVIGNCTRRRGYLEGMRLSNGQVVPGVGGGICQLANLLYWMVMHSALTVTERSEHSFDPFPDNGRVLPWGTGCSIVYNYVDLQFGNETDSTFQLRVSVGERHLEGDLRADREQLASYKVFARREHFYHLDGRYFRANEIWRTVIDRRTGDTVGEERLRHNCALVTYLPRDVPIVELSALDVGGAEDRRSTAANAPPARPAGR